MQFCLYVNQKIAKFDIHSSMVCTPSMSDVENASLPVWKNLPERLKKKLRFARQLKVYG